MEIVIIVCLIIVIALLIKDKITLDVSRQGKKKLTVEKQSNGIIDIMGEPKQRHSKLNILQEDQAKSVDEKSINSVQEGSFKDIDIIILQEGQDKGFKTIPNFEEEEEELQNNKGYYEDGKFATGITFDELGTFGTLIQNNTLPPELHNQAVQIVHKLAGTELQSCIESAIQDASQKIANLLNKGMLDHPNSKIKDSKNDLINFKITDFLN